MISNQNKGSLFLIPTTLGTSSYARAFPDFNRDVILKIKNFIVEDIRSARRFLKSIEYPGNFDDVNFQILDKHSREEDTISYLDPLKKNKDIGLMSEAGVPCLADPGNLIVKRAHNLGLNVVPLIGPSSILLALIASGFNGQNFSFLGYLPVKTHERNKKIKEIEMISRKTGQTMIFIEAPYRNLQLFQAIIENCNPNTMMCIATDLTLETEFIKSKSIAEWKKSIPSIQKRPTVFLFSA